MKKNNKENNKIPKVITPVPDIVQEESNRKFSYKLIDIKDNTIYELNF